MSDESPFEPGVLEELERQAAWKRDQDRIDASLTPLERRIRAKFEKALSGKVPPMELAGYVVEDPTTLLVFAEAYRREGVRLRSTVPAKPTKKELAAMDPHWVERRAQQRREHLELATRHEYAQWTLVAIWLAARGHQQMVDHFAGAVRMPELPMLPRNWHLYREQVYAAMGVPCRTWPKITTLPTPLTAS